VHLAGHALSWCAFMWQTVVSSDEESEGLGGRVDRSQCHLMEYRHHMEPCQILPQCHSHPCSSLHFPALMHLAQNKRASQLRRPVVLCNGVAEMRTVHVLNVEPQVSVSFIV